MTSGFVGVAGYRVGVVENPHDGAEDGTIEAIEIAGAPSILGVQWDPETLRHLPLRLSLFRAF